MGVKRGVEGRWGWVCFQETVIRAPPRGESPTCQRPPVERTIESPMARPRPAPAGARAVLGDAVEAVEQAGAFGLGDAGPAVLHGEADPVALGPDADADLAVGARVAARVVHQHAGQPVDPVRRRADQRGTGAHVRGDRGPDGAEPVGAGLGQRDQVHRLVAGGRRPGVEPGQPQHVVDQLAQPAALALDAGQRVPVLGRLARAGQGHVGFGPDHAERRAQLVRGVGGELQLAAPRLLDRRQRPQAHHQRTEEHGQQQEGPGDDLGVQQQPLGVRVPGPALARDQPAAAVAGQLEPERVRLAEVGGEGEPVVRRVRGQQAVRQPGRARAVRGHRAGRVDQPQEDRCGVGVHVIGRSRRGGALAEYGRIMSGGREPRAQVVVALRGLVAGEQHVEHDRADDVEDGDDRRRAGGDPGGGAHLHAGRIR